MLASYINVLIILWFWILAARWLMRFKRSYNYLSKFQLSRGEIRVNKSQDVCIIIPVLDETKRIEDTTCYILDSFKYVNNLNVVIVGAAASEAKVHFAANKKYFCKIENAKTIYEIKSILEEVMPKLVGREEVAGDDFEAYKDVAKDLIKARPMTTDIGRRLADEYGQVSFVQCPETNGVMSHQLNYAVDWYVNQTTANAEEILFVVYNADSRPDPHTVSWVLNTKDLLAKGNYYGPAIFQQFGHYVKNLGNFPEAHFPRGILQANAAWQSRWTLGFEVYNTLNQFQGGKPLVSTGMNKMKTIPRFNYCIGHGLFFDYGTYRMIGGFSENTMNEDAIFGLSAGYLGIPIIPIPYLEIADSPDTIRALVIQKSTWFWGPFQAFRYFRILLCTYPSARRIRGFLRLLWLTCSLYVHAIQWAVGPTLMCIMAINDIVGHQIIIVIGSLVTYILYLPILNIIGITLCVRLRPHKVMPINTRFWVLQVICGIFSYFIHGLSAYRTMCIKVVSIITRRAVQKQRTPLKE